MQKERKKEKCASGRFSFPSTTAVHEVMELVQSFCTNIKIFAPKPVSLFDAQNVRKILAPKSDDVAVAKK